MEFRRYSGSGGQDEEEMNKEPEQKKRKPGGVFSGKG
jgi:hypothetical protein